MIIIIILIEKDHFGDWSPEKDCCWSKTTVLHRNKNSQMIFLNQGMLLLG